MAKKFRNTKARKREIENFSKLWKSTQNKIYYRRKTQGVDFKPYLPIQSKREINNLSTKEIQKINNQLTKINKPKSDFFETKQFAKGKFPTALVDRITELEEKMMVRQKEIDKRDESRPIIQDVDKETNDTVLSQRLMGKPNITLVGILKPYDFDQASSVKSLESAIKVRENRLDPQWYEERKQIMKENYINSMIDLFGVEANDVVEILEEMQASDFYDLYEQYVSIDFLYVPSGKTEASTDEINALNTLREILSDFLVGKVDTRGKKFD